MSYAQFENQQKPSIPAPGKTKWYVSSVDGKPKYLDENGVEHDFVGEKGDQGDQGIQGPQGTQGDMGPQGPAGSSGTEIVFRSFIENIVLPDSENFSEVMSFNWNAPANGDYVMQAVIGVRPSSTGSDLIFEWDLDGLLVSKQDYYREEHKDASNVQSALRPFQIDLGPQSMGSRNLQLFFRKESAGGNAEIKHLSIFIWRIS